MPDRPVKGDLPTPEQERKAIRWLLGLAVMAGLGAAALLAGAGFLLGRLATWVFS